MPGGCALLSPVFSLLPCSIASSSSSPPSPPSSSRLEGSIKVSPSSSLEENRETDYLNPDSLEVFGMLYGLHPGGSNGHGMNDRDNEAKQLNYIVGWKRPDLAGFPPTLVQAGGGEVLRDDAVDFAEHAIRCEVQCQLEIYEGMFHAFQLFPRFVDAGKDAVVSICSFVEATARQQESKKTTNIFSAIVKDNVRVSSS